MSLKKMTIRTEYPEFDDFDRMSVKHLVNREEQYNDPDAIINTIAYTYDLNLFQAQQVYRDIKRGEL